MGRAYHVRPISRVVPVPALRAGFLAHAQHYACTVPALALYPPRRTVFV
jgi:hypothetical protein